jgi:hypothetical protein
LEGKTEAIRTGVEKKIDRFSEGDLGHATEVITALWKVAHKDGGVTAPSSAPCAVSLPSSLCHKAMLTENNQTAVRTSPAHWVAVKTALIKSIRRGIFFDRKYWARYSKAGDILKPVYFSSVIMEDKARQLKKSALGFGWQIHRSAESR